MRHNRKSFFKYTTSETALNILRSRKLRWSIPKIFNDPFDIPENLFDGLDIDSAKSAVVKHVKKLIVNPDKYDLKNLNDHVQIIFCLMQIVEKNRRPELLSEILNPNNFGPINLCEFRSTWKSLLQDSRVLCLTENSNSATMWSHYAENNKGVLFEFGCIKECDSVWLIANPIHYSDQEFEINTPEIFAEYLLYTPEKFIEKIFKDYLYTKTKEWEYENEWRIASWKRRGETGEYSDYEFHPKELLSITFGYDVTDEIRKKSMSMLNGKFAHVEIWQTTVGSGRFLSREKIR